MQMTTLLSTIQVLDHSQEFSQAQQGFISAQSSHSYQVHRGPPLHDLLCQVEGSMEPAVPYRVQQTIQWEGCRGQEDRRTMRLQASRCPSILGVWRMVHAIWCIVNDE